MSYIVQEQPYHDPETRRKKLAEAQTLLSGEASNWENVRAQTGDSGSQVAQPLALPDDVSLMTLGRVQMRQHTGHL
jgi:hypothetical protein